MQNKKISRNAPCPCGSGKKYKLCCMNQDLTHDPERLWRQLRQINDKFVNDLLIYARKTFQDFAILEAWDYFFNYRQDFKYSLDSPQNQAFIPWYLYNWQPEEEENGDTFEGLGIAQSYLKKYQSRLTEMERRFIEITCAENFSFYEVLQCQPGTGFLVRDILLEREINVIERSGSTLAKKGDIYFGRAIQFDQVGMLVGCGAVIIPTRYKTLIIDLRANIRTISDPITVDDLHDWDLEIRDLYFDIFNQMHAPIQFRNTDGDPIHPHELFFEITSPQIAFNRLKELALDTPETELIDNAEFDENGDLVKIEFSWLEKKTSSLPGGDYTSLGHITINGNKLKVFVNSANRAKKIRQEIENRLGDQITFKKTKGRSIESLMREKPNLKNKKPEPERTPETEAAIDQILEKAYDDHWNKWIDMKIPALGNLSPREAVKDKDGREKVIALLDDFERSYSEIQQGVDQMKFIRRIRQQLGL